MCGIIGVAACGRNSIDDATLARMRAHLRHRGPDDDGAWQDERVRLGHVRLAIQDPDHGGQPVEVGTPGTDDHVVLVFNGELWEHAPHRRALESAHGRSFRGHGDAETFAHLLSVHGPAALGRVRGMFAIAAYWPHARRLLLARDPLGVVPLVWTVAETSEGREIVFGSEARAVLAHPSVPIRPDWATVSAYLSTIRVTLDDRTLFEGLRTVRPGERVLVDLRERTADAGPSIDVASWFEHVADPDVPSDPIERAAFVRAVVHDAIDAHRLSDVGLGALLSGGIDSTILCARLASADPTLATWCTGAASVNGDDDPAHARAVAERIGVAHEHVPVTAGEFADRWPALVAHLGVPLGTPNEIAIAMLAERIRAAGLRTVMSGEGADELFAGYEPPLRLAAEWIRRTRERVPDTPDLASFHLSTIAWIQPAMKADVLTPPVHAAAEGDAALVASVERSFARIGDPLALRTHLDVQRDVNLPGLLNRLNAAMMSASVEARPPFADRRVAACAAGIPIDAMLVDPRSDQADGVPIGAAGGVATATRSRAPTKRVLRDAFAGVVPVEIAERPKASFPLPFQGWMQPVIDDVLASPSLQQVVSPAALGLVANDPAAHWMLAWPIANLGLWLRTWFD